MIVWLDLETTGLDPTSADILEVAVIVTDDALNEVARFERVVYSPLTARVKDVTDFYPERQRHLNSPVIDEVVYQMHIKNGLWRESMRGIALDTADREFAAFLSEYAGDKPQLAGSTIGFDRAFVNRHLPRSAALLHYRSIDVSSFNETAKRFWPKMFAARPRSSPDSKHRAMPDIEDSLAVYRYYARVLGPIGEVRS